MIIIYIFTHLFIYPGILKLTYVFSNAKRSLTRPKKKEEEKRGNLCTEQTAYEAGEGGVRLITHYSADKVLMAADYLDVFLLWPLITSKTGL